MLVTQTFDDGSSYTYDDATGQAVAATDYNGKSVAVPSSGANIAQQAWSLVNYGLRSVIDSKYRVQNAQTQVQVAQANSAAQINRIMPLLLVGGLALLAYRALAH